MQNDLENEVNDKKDKKLWYQHRIELTTYSIITLERVTTAGLCGQSESGVKLQYKLAKTRPVNIARIIIMFVY